MGVGLAAELQVEFGLSVTSSLGLGREWHKDHGWK